MKNPIPEQLALEICELVRKRNSKKKLILAKGQCWGCMKYSTKKMTSKLAAFSILRRKIIEDVS